MTIPNFDSNGWLPAGIYDATLDEIKERFGRTQGSDCRPDFVAQLMAYVDEAKDCEYIKYIIINGSFVSDQSHPGDIDILVVLAQDFNLAIAEIAPWEYNLVSPIRVKKRYRCLHFFQALEGSPVYSQVIRAWSKNRGNEQKGILRIVL